MKRRSAKLDDLLPRADRTRERVARAVEGGDERRIAAVAKSHPDQPSDVAGAVRKEHEVFVLAHDDAFLGCCACPDLKVINLAESDVQNVDAIAAPPAKVDGESQRQLVVDEQLHAVWSTT